MKKISVAMATYNGEKYIKKQIESILINLKENDELIISDDGSKDKTLDIIKSIKDKRIKIISGPKQGVIKNFENALNNCTGDYIFLSDQDDIWEKDKVKKVVPYLEKYIAVVHDNETVLEDGTILFESWFKHRNSKPGLINNLIKNRYLGCCMAFKKELLDYALPFPNNIEMHDWYLGLIAEKKGKTVFINDKLIKYRRHENNTSSLKHYGLLKMIKNRLVLIKSIINK